MLIARNNDPSLSDCPYASDQRSVNDKIADLGELLDAELEGIEFFEQIQRYMVVEPCVSTGRAMLAEMQPYRELLLALKETFDRVANKRRS